MAKANQRARAGEKTHAISNDYKIPYKDRDKFMRNNTKWVSKEKYDRYLEWKERNKI